MSGYTALPTKNPGDVLTSALWNTYLQGNADNGFMRMLADTTLVGSAATIDFTSIPATFAHLRLAIYGRGDTVAVGTNILARLNNDSTAVYQYQLLLASAAVASAVEGLAQTSIVLGNMPAASAGANFFGACVIDLLHYAGATNQKVLEYLTGFRSGGATGNGTTYKGSGWWANGAAINRLTLIPAAGNFVAGTRATLYGIPQ